MKYTGGKEEGDKGVRFNEEVSTVTNPSGGDNMNNAGVQQDMGGDYQYDPSYFQGDGAGQADAFEKNCPVCTMLNPVQATECEMCTSKFPN